MNLSIKESEEFYDDWTSKLLLDYIHGNKRLISAIKFSISEIPQTTKNILDIGCGIGWSTHEIANNNPDSYCLGIDLSGELINIAGNLFEAENLFYRKYNILDCNSLQERKFDVITLLDVYEHIPMEEQERVNSILSDLLHEKGKIIMACPTIYHQKWLRKHKPSNLQPIDEDITYSTINKLANDMDGYVTKFNLISIFNRFDYFYATVERANVFEEYSDPFKSSREIETFQERLNRIQKSSYSFLLEQTNYEKDKNDRLNIIKRVLNRLKTFL